MEECNDQRQRPARTLRPAVHGLFLAVTLLTSPVRAADMDAEIDYLIESVAKSPCTFVRNGREHDAAAASGHLQMKRKRGKRYYDTTEEFIERIASRSSWTGKDYQIRCGDADPEPARDWFFSRLKVFREGEAR